MANIEGTYHSFWTKNYVPDISQHKVTKWGSEKYRLAAFALSFFMARRVYRVNKLVTDNYGKYLLCDFLELPYDEVSYELEAFQWITGPLWAMGKVVAYGIMGEEKKRFAHIDDDFILYRRLDDSGEATFQHVEDANASAYAPTWEKVMSETHTLPYFYSENHRERKFAQNASIVTFNDNWHLREFSNTTLAHLYANREYYKEYHLCWTHNLILEQYGLWAYCEHHGIKSNNLFNDLTDAHTRKGVGMTHIWGAASNEAMKAKLMRALFLVAPKQYHILEEAFKEKPEPDYVDILKWPRL